MKIMKKVLIVVDMQKDFVDGALGSREAAAIVPNVAGKIETFDGDGILVTYDTHYADYMETLEGKKLPVSHCVEGTEGHALDKNIEKALMGKKHIDVKKNTFGSFDLPRILAEQYPGEELEIEVVGLCTDICVVSNALILRAAFPNAKITVDAGCCAGVSPATHEAAFATMACCQIDITGK